MNPKIFALTHRTAKSSRPCRTSLWRSSLLTLSAVALVSSYGAQAATLTWNGNGDGSDWSTSNGSQSRNNWGGTQFATGDNVIFGGSTGLSPSIGGTSLTAGSITFNNTAGAFTIGGTATLTINGGVVNSDNSLQSFSVTTITLGASQTWNAGTVSGGGLAFTGTTLNLGSLILTIDGTNNTSISNVITGTGTSGITKTGSGVLTLSGVNTYTGLTTVTAGTLAYGVTNALSTGAVTVNGGTLALSTFSDTVGAVTLSSGSITSTSGVLTGTSYILNDTGSISAILAGAANLSKTGAGTATLSAINTYSGTTAITGGTLVGTSADRSFGTNLSGISVGGSGTLSLLNDSTVSFTNGTSAYNIANSASGATINVDRVSGTGSNTITVGNLTTTSTAVTWALNFTGANGVSLNAGSLTTPTAAAGSHTVNNNIAGGGILTLASVAGGGTGANATLIFAGTGNTTVTGAITQAATAQALTKNGAGTLTLSGTNTYTGITSINTGALVVNGNQSSATGAVSVAGIAKLFGTGTIGGATTILGTQSSGASSGATGTQTFSSSLTYSTGSIFEWDINVTSGVDTHDHVVANSLLGSGAVFKIVGSGDGFAAAFWNSNQNWSASDLFGITNVNLATIFSGANSTFTANPTEGSFSFTSIGSGTNNNLKWTPVPEPTSALAGILLGAGLLRRKRDQRRSA